MLSTALIVERLAAHYLKEAVKFYVSLSLPLLAFCLAFFALSLPGFVEGQQTSEDELTDTLDAYIDANYSRSVIAALITPEKTYTSSAGEPVVDEDTLFEIGSVTKVFTTTLLASMVEDEMVNLDTTIGEVAPQDFVFANDVASITLEELATHRSGLPRLPLNALSGGILRPNNPYVGATPKKLYTALEELDSDDISGRGEFSYSNFGSALLGNLLSNKAGQPYETLVEERITNPLGMDNTYFASAHDDRVIQGHRENLRPTSRWELEAYNPAGGLVSSTSDLIHFAETALDESFSPLRTSMEVVHRDDERKTLYGLGWFINNAGDEPVIWHNGRTGGFYSFLGIMPESKKALVFLTNTSDASEMAPQLLHGDVDIEPVERDWFSGALTWGLVLLAIFSLVPSIRKLRRRDTAGESELGIVNLLNTGLQAVIWLAMAWVLGAWHWIPELLWWLSVIVTAALAVWVVVLADDLPWFSDERLWRKGLVVAYTLVSVAVFGWVLMYL